MDIQTDSNVAKWIWINPSILVSYTVVSQLLRQYTLKYNYFNARPALWEVSNVILKFGFTRAFGATVNGDAKNIMYREFAMYLPSFFRGNQKLWSSSSG